MSFFYWADASGPVATEFRNVVLVCHGSYSERGFLRNLGIDVTTITPLVALFDTLKISEYVLGRGLALADLLQTLGCPCHNVHVAGNDANFTLRALLLLGLKTQDGATDLNYVQVKTLRILENIARQPLPNISERLAEKRKSNRQERECQDWAESIGMMDIGDCPLFDT